MREALPNATFVGFTGTPLDRDDRSTPRVFGEYADISTIRQGGGGRRDEADLLRVTDCKVAGERKRAPPPPRLSWTAAAKASGSGEDLDESVRVPLEALPSWPERALLQCSHDEGSHAVDAFRCPTKASNGYAHRFVQVPHPSPQMPWPPRPTQPRRAARDASFTTATLQSVTRSRSASSRRSLHRLADVVDVGVFAEHTRGAPVIAIERRSREAHERRVGQSPRASSARRLR